MISPTQAQNLAFAAIHFAIGRQEINFLQTCQTIRQIRKKLYLVFAI